MAFKVKSPNPISFCFIIPCYPSFSNPLFSLGLKILFPNLNCNSLSHILLEFCQQSVTPLKYLMLTTRVASSHSQAREPFVSLGSGAVEQPHGSQWPQTGQEAVHSWASFSTHRHQPTTPAGPLPRPLGGTPTDTQHLVRVHTLKRTSSGHQGAGHVLQPRGAAEGLLLLGGA